MQAKTSIILILEDIRSTHNVGSIFRTAEVFGVDEIYLCGYTPAPSYNGDTRLPHIAKKLSRQIEKTALGAEKIVKFKTFESTKPALDMAKNLGYQLASLEQAKNSTKIENYNSPDKIAVVLGNEVDGVSRWTIESSDVILEIEQFGQKESLNVANAAAIAMYAIRSK